MCTSSKTIINWHFIFNIITVLIFPHHLVSWNNILNMEKHAMNLLNTIITYLSKTNSRDNIWKLVQYLSMYLHASALKGERTMYPAFDKVHYNMWITRKLLRMGLVTHHFNEIITSFKKSFDGKNRDEQVGSKFGKNSDSSDKSNDKGHESKAFEFGVFDESKYTLLSNIWNFLFCVVDIPFFFKEMRVLKISRVFSMKLLKLKYIFWIWSCILNIVREYILVRSLNSKVKRLKNFMFLDKDITEEQRKNFDGKHSSF